MAAFQRILDVLSQRIASLVGGAVASRLETMVVLEQVEQQDELEQRARQLENEGKTELADMVRRRALGIDPTNPGGQGQVIHASLCQEMSTEGNPALLEHVSDQEESEPKQKRRRRAPRRTKASQPEGGEENSQ